MGTFDLIATLITLSAAFAYANRRLLKLPPTTGLMLIALTFAVALTGLGLAVPTASREARAVVDRLDLSGLLLHGMLGFLLFAGALHLQLAELGENRLLIGLLATAGVAASTALVGGLAWLLLPLLGLHLPLIHCLLFGALISPTDPIAVLALVKQVRAPKALEAQIAGESLFNDGVGVVLFLGLLEVAAGQDRAGPGTFVRLFAREALGGAMFGLAVGWVTCRLLRPIDDYPVEILLTLAAVAGGYALAERLHLSAPIAVVVAGLVVGNAGRRLAMSPRTREHLDTFWGLIDEFLNAVLFVLIGLEVLIVTLSASYLAAGALMVPVVLFARLATVAPAVALLRLRRATAPGTVRVLTWGGLRGGLSVAMALALPPDLPGAPPHARELILTMTYVVVAFSVLVQGLTAGWLIRRLFPPPAK
jgi:CPA1 family monovalent cation:H+ antiporter